MIAETAGNPAASPTVAGKPLPVDGAWKGVDAVAVDNVAIAIRTESLVPTTRYYQSIVTNSE